MAKKKPPEVTPPEAAGGAYEPPSLTIEQCAAMLNVSNRTVLRLIAAGSIPPPVYYGRRMRFRPSEVRAVAESGPRLPGTFEVPDSPNRLAAKKASVKRLARMTRARYERERKAAKRKAKPAKKGGKK